MSLNRLWDKVAMILERESSFFSWILTKWIFLLLYPPKYSQVRGQFHPENAHDLRLVIYDYARKPIKPTHERVNERSKASGISRGFIKRFLCARGCRIKGQLACCRGRLKGRTIVSSTVTLSLEHNPPCLNYSSTIPFIETPGVKCFQPLKRAARSGARHWKNRNYFISETD